MRGNEMRGTVPYLKYGKVRDINAEFAAEVNDRRDEQRERTVTLLEIGEEGEEERGLDIVCDDHPTNSLALV